MKDLQRLIIYSAIALGIILGLNELASHDIVSSNVIGILAIISVVVVPVIIAVRMSHKERERQ